MDFQYTSVFLAVLEHKMCFFLACRYLKIYTQRISHAPEEQKHLRQGSNIQMVPKYPN